MRIVDFAELLRARCGLELRVLQLGQGLTSQAGQVQAALRGAGFDTSVASADRTYASDLAAGVGGGLGGAPDVASFLANGMPGMPQFMQETMQHNLQNMMS